MIPVIMIMMCSRMKMRVWRRMEMEPVFAHRGEMTLGWILIHNPQSSLKQQNI